MEQASSLWTELKAPHCDTNQHSHSRDKCSCKCPEAFSSQLYFCQNLLHCQRFLEFLQNFIKFSIQTCSAPLSSLVKPYFPVCWSPEASHAGYPATPQLYQQHILKDNMKLSWRMYAFPSGLQTCDASHSRAGDLLCGRELMIKHGQTH